MGLNKKKRKYVWCTQESIQFPDEKERKFVRCPNCNKRLMLTERYSGCEDFGCIHLAIPPHKRLV